MKPVSILPLLIIATVWKNGTATMLTDGPKNVDAYSVYVNVP
jgi:hypothetical protein